MAKPFNLETTAAEQHGPPKGPVRRVALVLSELRAGGAERVVVHLACELKRLGIEARVICLGREGALARELHERQVPVLALGSLKGYDLPAVWRLAKVLRRFRPDVINVHDRASLPYVYLANRLSGARPVVLSCHGLLLDAGTQARWIERFAMRGVSAMTAVSHQTADLYARFLDWRGPVRAIPNGVPTLQGAEDARRRTRADLGLAPNTPVLLAVGNIKPEKGFEDLLEAAAILRNHHGLSGFTVLVAGGTADEAYRKRLAQTAHNLRLGETVRFLGYRDDAAHLYKAADGFVLSSRTEGLPMVLLEAMAAGLPIVATRVGGVPNVIADSQTGLLVPASHPDALAAGMAKIIGDTALRKRLGDAAQARVAEQFGVRRMAERYAAVFREVQGSRSIRTGPRRPRILMLGPLPPLTGGMVTVTENLRRSELRKRCRLTVLNNGKITPSNRSLRQGVWAQMQLLGRVAATLLGSRPQIVHFQTCALFSFWRDMLHAAAALLAGCRVVWHIHDGTFESFLRDAPLLRKNLLRTALRSASRVILLSEETRKRLQPLAPEAPWTVVSNGVPIPPAEPRSDQHSARFLFIGNLTHRKGAYDLVAATSLALRDGLQGQVLLAGEERAQGQREELLRRAQDRGCRERIRLLGLIKGSRKEEALRSADVVVLPSYAEGLPMAILEGMSYGLPVIATSVGAIPEAVTDGVEGYLIAPGDVDALADRLVRLDGDPALRRRMAQAARRRVQAEYSIRAMVDRIMGIYQDILGSGKGC